MNNEIKTKLAVMALAHAHQIEMLRDHGVNSSLSCFEWERPDGSMGWAYEVGYENVGPDGEMGETFYADKLSERFRKWQ